MSTELIYCLIKIVVMLILGKGYWNWYLCSYVALKSSNILVYKPIKIQETINISYSINHGVVHEQDVDAASPAHSPHATPHYVINVILEIMPPMVVKQCFWMWINTEFIQEDISEFK